MSRVVPRTGKFLAVIASILPLICACSQAWVNGARPGSIGDSVLAITYTTFGSCCPKTWKPNSAASNAVFPVSVNRQSVDVVGLEHGARYWGGVGSFDASSVLIEGQNQFSFDFHSECPDSQGGGQVVLEYYAKGKKTASTICKNSFSYGNNTIQCSLALKDLSELDPDLFQQIESYKAEIRSLQDQANTAAAAVKDLQSQADALQREVDGILNLVEELKNILAGLTGLDFDQLSTEKLGQLIQEHSDIGSVFHRLKGELDHLRQQVNHETTAVQYETTQLVDELKNQFQAGADLDVNLDFLEEDIGAAFSAEGFDLPQGSESYGVNLFQAASNETIQKLQAAETKGNATEFLSIVKIWTHWQNETDEAMQQMHPTAATCHALNQAKTQVLDYLKSQVDKDGFFWKARIPDSVKRVVGKLKDWDEKLGHDLKEELNTWQETLNPTQLQVVEVISSLDPVLDKFKDPRLQNENPDPRLEDVRNIAQVALKVATEKLIRAAGEAVDSRSPDLESEQEQELTPAEEYLVQAQTGVQLASGFADFVLGAADIAIGFSPAGSVKDLVEAMTGVSVLHPTGEKLEIWQRGILAVSGVAGIISLGGSNVFTKAFTKVFTKIFGVVEEIWKNSKAWSTLSGKILCYAEKIIDSAGRLFGKTATHQELKVYADVLRKYKIDPPTWVEKIAFKPDLQKHMSEVAGFSQKVGVKGAHNLENFEKVIAEKNIRIVSKVEHPTVKGVYDVRYEIPAFNGRGEQIGFKEAMTKTVYDPKVISDTEMLTLGQVASNPGFTAAANSGVRAAYDATAGGITFRVYVENGVITNVHPKF